MFGRNRIVRKLAGFGDPRHLSDAELAAVVRRSIESARADSDKSSLCLLIGLILLCMNGLVFSPEAAFLLVAGLYFLQQSRDSELLGEAMLRAAELPQVLKNTRGVAVPPLRRGLLNLLILLFALILAAILVRHFL